MSNHNLAARLKTGAIVIDQTEHSISGVRWSGGLSIVRHYLKIAVIFNKFKVDIFNFFDNCFDNNLNISTALSAASCL